MLPFFFFPSTGCWTSFLAWVCWPLPWVWAWTGSGFLSFFSGLKSGYSLVYSYNLLATWMFLFLTSIISFYKASCFACYFYTLATTILISELVSHYIPSFVVSSLTFSSLNRLFSMINLPYLSFCSLTFVIFSFMVSITEAGTKLSSLFLYLSVLSISCFASFYKAAFFVLKAKSYSGTFYSNLGFFFPSTYFSNLFF